MIIVPVTINHFIDSWFIGLTHNLWQRVALQVEQDASCLQAGPELKQAVEGQRGHMRLAPSFSSLLHLLLKLHPPTEMRENQAELFDCLKSDRRLICASQQDVM